MEEKLPNNPFAAGFWLIASIPLGGLLAGLTESLLGHSIIEEILGIPIVVVAFFGTAYLWARSLAKRSGIENSPVFNVAGGLGISLSIIGGYAGFGGLYESILHFFGVTATVGGTNSEFIIIFVIWTGFVAGGAGFALGLALKNMLLAVRLFVVGFTTGAALFFLITRLMNAAGFIVGIPRSDGIPSMPIITLLGIWSTALLGSELFGRILARSRQRIGASFGA